MASATVSCRINKEFQACLFPASAFASSSFLLLKSFGSTPASPSSSYVSIQQVSMILDDLTSAIKRQCNAVILIAFHANSCLTRRGVGSKTIFVTLTCLWFHQRPVVMLWKLWKPFVTLWASPIGNNAEHREIWLWHWYRQSLVIHVTGQSISWPILWLSDCNEGKNR